MKGEKKKKKNKNYNYIVGVIPYYGKGHLPSPKTMKRTKRCIRLSEARRK